MLIAFDENLLSKKLKKPFIDAGHSVQNVEEMGWCGIEDKELLALAHTYLDLVIPLKIVNFYF